MPDQRLQDKTDRPENLEMPNTRKAEISMRKALCVGRDVSTAEFIRTMAGDSLIDINQISNTEEAEALLEGESFDVIASSYDLEGMDGIEFLKHAHRLNPKAITILNVYDCFADILGQAYREGICYFFDPAPFDGNVALKHGGNASVSI